MRRLPEGVRTYPRWEGVLRTGPLSLTIAGQEVRRAWLGFWSRLALTAVFAFTIVNVGQLYQLRQDRGDIVHTMDAFVTFLNNMRWGALAVTATVAGPALLEDHRLGALELYLSRAVTTTEYLTGKILAIFSLATLSLFVPALIYWGSTFFLFKDHPDNWEPAIFPALLYALMWGLLLAGLGLGLSAIARDSRAATLILLGGFAVGDVFINQLLFGITRNRDLQILSPFSAVGQQTSWLFDLPEKFTFPPWLGLAVWGALVVLGWGLLAWKRPRVRGAERAGA